MTKEIRLKDQRIATQDLSNNARKFTLKDKIQAINPRN